MAVSSSRPWLTPFQITVSAAFIIADAASASSGSGLAASAPDGFEALTAERLVMLDAWFGGEKIGEVQAAVSPGQLRFSDPAALSVLIPDVKDRQELARRLSGGIASNVALACGPATRDDCGTLAPGQTGIVLDEERFRVDIFVDPAFLTKPDPSAQVFLPAPEETPSFVSLFGATVSGSSRSQENWHLQNRTIASLGAVRLRSDSSLATGSGLTFDNLTLEADRRDWRYSGGIFWAPGTDLIGRRKIVGIGAATQLDTLLNKDAVQATPLSIFLQQPARVDVLVDGRVVTSRIYPAGNRLVETASLPNGSYDVTLRIQEDGRPARLEQRFFTKGSAMAPMGQPMFSAFVGLLPSSSRGLALKGDTLFYQGNAAYRLTSALGVDASVLGTQHKAILEAGAHIHTSLAEVRVAALVSSAADHGALVRLTSRGQGPFTFSFDLRKVVSKDDEPLLPLTTSKGTFSEEPDSGFSDRGSYSQIISILGYRLGEANLRLTGIYRKNASADADYSVGASAELPVLRTGRFDIVLQADARKTNRDFASFIGARFLMNRGNLSVSGSGGYRQRSNGPDRPVGEVHAAYQGQVADNALVAGDLALGRDLDGSYARASAYARSSVVNARADFLQQFGDHRTSQYAVTIDGGIASNGSGLALGGQSMNDAAVMVSVTGGEPGQQFEVLVDNVRRGTVENGENLTLFLPPYEQYDVRLRPLGSQVSSFDASARRLALYPGNVARLDWEVTPLFILFARAVGPDGKPVADADIVGAHGIGRTDGEGYFQIETKSGDELRVTALNGDTCAMTVRPAKAVDGLVSGGEMICR